MSDNLSTFLIFFAMVVFGVGLEMLLGKFLFKPRKNFSFGRYTFLLLSPMAAVVVIGLTGGIRIFYVFLTFSFVGAFLEWLIGFSFEFILGYRLWTYHEFHISRYTSILSLPFWGMAGVMFYLLAKIFV